MEHPLLRKGEKACSELVSELERLADTHFNEVGAEAELQWGVIDRAFGKCFQRIQALRRYCGVLRKAQSESISIGKLFNRWNPSGKGVVLGFVDGQTASLRGDRRQLLDCLDALTQHVRDQAPDAFEVEVHTASDTPRIYFKSLTAEIDYSVLRIGPGLTLDLSTLRQQWAAATGGGVVYEEDAMLVLELEGDEHVHGGLAPCGKAEAFLSRAERSMRPWRGAIGTTETGYASKEESLRLYEDLLRRTVICLRSASDAFQREAN